MPGLLYSNFIPGSNNMGVLSREIVNGSFGGASYFQKSPFQPGSWSCGRTNVAIIDTKVTTNRCMGKFPLSRSHHVTGQARRSVAAFGFNNTAPKNKRSCSSAAKCVNPSTIITPSKRTVRSTFSFG